VREPLWPNPPGLALVRARTAANPNVSCRRCCGSSRSNSVQRPQFRCVSPPSGSPQDRGSGDRPKWLTRARRLCRGRLARVRSAASSPHAGCTVRASRSTFDHLGARVGRLRGRNAPSTGDTRLASDLRVTTHAAGGDCLNWHVRGPVPLNCAPPPRCVSSLAVLRANPPPRQAPGSGEPSAPVGGGWATLSDRHSSRTSWSCLRRQAPWRRQRRTGSSVTGGGSSRRGGCRCAHPPLCCCTW
jgi:hypothetical protein